MKTARAKEEFINLLSQSNYKLDELKPSEGISLMLKFYRQVRAENCALDEDGDMLLYQWGTYDWGTGRSFAFNITRQFVDSSKEEDEDAMSQLSLTFYFQPIPKLNEMKASNQWCSAPEELDDFMTFIIASEAFQQVASSQADRISLEISKV
jgi:hypothetical protein